MPQYYFDFRGDDRSSRDADGSHWPNNDAAERQAVAALMSRFSNYSGHQGYLQANVRDEAGTLLFRTTLTLRSERL